MSETYEPVVARKRQQCIFMRDETFARKPREVRSDDAIHDKLAAKVARLDAQHAKRCAQASKRGEPPPAKTESHLREAARLARKQKSMAGGAGGRGRGRPKSNTHMAEGSPMQRWSAWDVVHEAERSKQHPEAHAHLADRAIEPALLYGEAPSLVMMRVEEQAEKALRDDLRQPLPSSANVMMCRVQSHPKRIWEMLRDYEEQHQAPASREMLRDFLAKREPGPVDVPASWLDVHAWMWDAVDWAVEDLRDSQGRNRVRSVVLHCDEGNVHFHVFAPAELDQDGRMQLETFFRPLAAQKEAERRLKAEGRQAKPEYLDNLYTNELEKTLDRYWQGVGQKHGMDRKSLSPRKRDAFADYDRADRQAAEHEELQWRASQADLWASRWQQSAQDANARADVAEAARAKAESRAIRADEVAAQAVDGFALQAEAVRASAAEALVAKLRDEDRAMELVLARLKARLPPQQFEITKAEILGRRHTVEARPLPPQAEWERERAEWDRQLEGAKAAAEQSSRNASEWKRRYEELREGVWEWVGTLARAMMAPKAEPEAVQRIESAEYDQAGIMAPGMLARVRGWLRDKLTGGSGGRSQAAPAPVQGGRTSHARQAQSQRQR